MAFSADFSPVRQVIENTPGASQGMENWGKRDRFVSGHELIRAETF
jgi:hypothetical protein